MNAGDVAPNSAIYYHRIMFALRGRQFDCWRIEIERQRKSSRPSIGCLILSGDDVFGLIWVAVVDLDDVGLTDINATIDALAILPHRVISIGKERRIMPACPLDIVLLRETFLEFASAHESIEFFTQRDGNETQSLVLSKVW